MGTVKHASTELARAKNIAETLGTRRAASYLRNRGWSLEAALWTLARAEVRGGI